MTITSDPDFEVNGPGDDETDAVGTDPETNADGNTETETSANGKIDGDGGEQAPDGQADQTEAAEDEAATEDETGAEDGTGADFDLSQDEDYEAWSYDDPGPPRSTDTRSSDWSVRQIASVVQRALAVFVVMGMLGYGLGATRGNTYVARTEFVYTLDESVPDSFLREDRRLLTQVVTFKSDAVLTPVSKQFDLTVDELRSRIDIETLNLSEVLRLDVSDRDPDRAVAISRSVLDRYLQVITDATPAGNSTGLDARRLEVTSQLATADAAGRSLLEARQQDAALQIRQESIQRQIDLKNEQLNRIQGSLDDSLVQILAAQRVARLNDEHALVQQELAAFETELTEVGSQRAVLATKTTAEPALLREIDRLEAKLTTIDDELAERELGPLVASPIRELSEPLILFRSIHIFGLQGMAIGLLAAVPLAALVAYRTRKRQLWFE